MIITTILGRFAPQHEFLYKTTILMEHLFTIVERIKKVSSESFKALRSSFSALRNFKDAFQTFDDINYILESDVVEDFKKNFQWKKIPFGRLGRKDCLNHCISRNLPYFYKTIESYKTNYPYILMLHKE